MNLPILKGITDANLLVGATTMRPDQIMGEGNYPLAGHYNKSQGKLFHHLMDVDVGAIIKITNKETVYEYRVYDTIIVPETDVHLIEDQEAIDRGKPITSLMVCYYTSKNGKIYFVLGELIDEYPYN
ncbi:MAG: class A sortase [Clostridiales bacterium]|nr:class A sortase [Clostridiales bacterium]